MKCICSVFDKTCIKDTVVISSDELYIFNSEGEQKISVDSIKCFNTVMNLFALEENWEEKECINPLYKIEFVKGDIVKSYTFDIDSLPFNFPMFIGSIEKLVDGVL